MYLQKIPVKSSGRILLTVVRSVWKDGKPKKEMVKRIGYVDEFTDLYDDPIEHFKAVVKEMTLQDKAAKESITLTMTAGDTLKEGSALRKSIGYLPLNQLYEQLELPRFMANRQRNLKIGFSLNAVLKLLVFGRMLFPGSKKKTYETREMLFEKQDFSLDDVYRSLSFLHRYADDIKLFLHEQVTLKYGRDTTVMFYDVTNYYFEIDEQDRLRRKGVSKEHRPNPIVQMGLLMDNKGLPMTYELFSGKTNDCETLMPVLRKVRDQFQIKRFIVVADRGLNTSNNIGMCIGKGDGYIYGQSILRAPASLKRFCLDESGYVSYGKDEAAFKIKSRTTPKTIEVEDIHGNMVSVDIDEKQVVFYSRKYAERARAARQEAIDKALRLMQSPSQSSLSNVGGARKYIKGLEIDKETGEILDTGTTYCLDEAKIEKEAQYDGYYAVVTSELDMSDNEVMDRYRGLWKIEESFRLTKSEFEARPVYVSREEHINAHFLTCFIALLFTRLLQQRTHHQFPASGLLEAMRQASGTYLDDGYYIFDFYNQALKALGEAFNIPYERRLFNRNEINKMKKPL